ncbi:MAG: tripartite tricarboxylate transporter TctB family protein [Pseudomonadota bacterium]
MNDTSPSAPSAATKRPQAVLTGLTLLSALAGLFFTIRQQRLADYPEGLSYLFPGFIFLCLLGVGLSFLRQTRTPAPSSPAHAAGTLFNTAAFCQICGLLLGYVVVIPFIGFVLATLVFQAMAVALVFKRRGLLWLCALPICVTAAFTLFFTKALSVPLPRGTGLFYSLNNVVI